MIANDTNNDPSHDSLSFVLFVLKKEEIMPIRNKIIALAFGIVMLLLIIELVRRRKLREEYSWLWLMTGAIILLLALWFDLLKWITHLIGAVTPSSTIFLFAFLFLILISLHFSVAISRLADRNKELAQRYALLELELNEMKKRNLHQESVPPVDPVRNSSGALNPAGII
jgi:membrane-associated HD superfamily phosphohydrolase